MSDRSEQKPAARRVFSYPASVMSTHTRTICFAIFACFFLASCTQKPKPQPAVEYNATVKHSTLEGSWRMIDDRLEQAGLILIWTFQNGRAIVSTGDGEAISDSAYEIDESHSPKHITIFIRDTGGEEDRLGIYRITDNMLQLALSLEKDVRPNEFGNELGSRFERMYD